jgi:hypothetical protein
MDFGWWNDVETDYGLARNFMTKEILGLDTLQILLGVDSPSSKYCSDASRRGDREEISKFPRG